MRISTSLKYELGVSQFARKQQQQIQLFEQISTGRRVVRPGDDPLAASQAVTLSQSQSLNERYTSNRAIATQSLGMSDTALTTTVSLLDAIGGRLVQAGNGSYSAADLQALAAELKSSYNALVTQANSTDGNGIYLFSGNQGDTAPYALDADGWIDGGFNGDGGERLVQADQTRQIATGNSADQIFGDVFNALRDVIEDLEQGQTDSLSAAQTAVKTTYQQVLTTQASVGARMNELSALDSIGSARSLSYSQQFDTLVKIDEYSAYSMLTYYENSLQASVLAFQKIQGLSLFNN